MPKRNCKTPKYLTAQAQFYLKPPEYLIYHKRAAAYKTSRTALPRPFKLWPPTTRPNLGCRCHLPQTIVAGSMDGLVGRGDGEMVTVRRHCTVLKRWR